MSPQDIKASFEARQHAVSELRRLVEDVDGAEFNAEQQAEFDRHNEAIDSLDARIRSGLDHIEREAKATAALDEFRAYGDLTTPHESAVDAKVDEAVVDAMWREVKDECARAHDPHKIDPGAWDVVLAPAAVTEILEWLGEIAFTSNSMMASEILEGDLMLVDVDGEWDTILDRYPVAVGTVEMNESSGKYTVVVTPAPGKLFGLPSGLTLASGTTRVVWLGDSFLLSGLSDTSGNNGFNEFGDEFSFCDPGLAGCAAGIFTY